MGEGLPKGMSLPAVVLSAAPGGGGGVCGLGKRNNGNKAVMGKEM